MTGVQTCALPISNPGDLKTVLDSILARARTLVGAEYGSVVLRRGDVMRVEAVLAGSQILGHEQPFDTVQILGHEQPFDTVSERFNDDLCVIDNDFDPSTSSNAHWAAEARERGVTRLIRIALRQDGALIGTIPLHKSGAPFDDRDAKILKTFAEQASIAVSNAKLFNDLDAALERQAAMIDVLDAVSTARTDLQPVYDAVLRHADRLCGEQGAVIDVRVGEVPSCRRHPSALGRRSRPGVQHP